MARARRRLRGSTAHRSGAPPADGEATTRMGPLKPVATGDTGDAERERSGARFRTAGGRWIQGPVVGLSWAEGGALLLPAGRHTGLHDRSVRVSGPLPGVRIRGRRGARRESGSRPRGEEVPREVRPTLSVAGRRGSRGGGGVWGVGGEDDVRAPVHGSAPDHLRHRRGGKDREDLPGREARRSCGGGTRRSLLGRPTAPARVPTGPVRLRSVPDPWVRTPRPGRTDGRRDPKALRRHPRCFLV